MIPRRSTALVAALLLLAGWWWWPRGAERGLIGPTPRAPLPTTAEVEVRRVAVANAPPGYDQPYVEFGDHDHGYALFASCGGRPPVPGCPALLFLTEDGGESWFEIGHPRPLAKRQQLHVVADIAALFVAGEGWYVTLDDGFTFQHTPAAESAWRSLHGGVQRDPRTGRVVRWYGGQWRLVPVQPPVSRPTAVGGGGGLVVAAAVERGRPVAAVSVDSGAGWRRTLVPPADGEVAELRIAAAADGDVWLIGERRHRGRFPALWRYDGGWQPVSVDPAPEPFGSVVPLGRGRLAVSGPDGGGVVDADAGRYVAENWPLRRDHRLTLLADGTLLARGTHDVLLGLWRGEKWVRVEVVPSGQ